MKSVKFSDGFEALIFEGRAKPGGWLKFPYGPGPGEYTGRWESRAAIAGFIRRHRRMARRLQGC